MVRTQIQLTEEQARRLKSLASSRGVSMAELIRQGLDALLASRMEKSPEESYQKAREAAGKHHSGLHDVSRRHDEYLGEDSTR